MDIFVPKTKKAVESIWYFLEALKAKVELWNASGRTQPFEAHDMILHTLTDDAQDVFGILKKHGVLQGSGVYRVDEKLLDAWFDHYKELSQYKNPLSLQTGLVYSENLKSNFASIKSRLIYKGEPVFGEVKGEGRNAFLSLMVKNRRIEGSEEYRDLGNPLTLKEMDALIPLGDMSREKDRLRQFIKDNRRFPLALNAHSRPGSREKAFQLVCLD